MIRFLPAPKTKILNGIVGQSRWVAFCKRIKFSKLWFSSSVKHRLHSLYLTRSGEA